MRKNAKWDGNRARRMPDGRSSLHDTSGCEGACVGIPCERRCNAGRFQTCPYVSRPFAERWGGKCTRLIGCRVYGRFDIWIEGGPPSLGRPADQLSDLHPARITKV